MCIFQILEHRRLPRRRSRTRQRSSREPEAPPPVANQSENRDVPETDTLQRQMQGTLSPTVGINTVEPCLSSRHQNLTIISLAEGQIMIHKDKRDQ